MALLAGTLAGAVTIAFSTEAGTMALLAGTMALFSGTVAGATTIVAWFAPGVAAGTALFVVPQKGATTSALFVPGT